MPDKTLNEVMEHYKNWNDDMEVRLNRPNGWNDITDAYYGKLPDDWPFFTRVVDPRIRTTIIEKNARLLNSRLRGRLVPREGSDIIKARINNALLEFQWDTAKHAGSMLEKWSRMDIDARLYGSCFALVKWKYEEEKDKKTGETKVVFNGNEFTPLDVKDCGIDQTAAHIRNARWFQVREWVVVDDLKRINDASADEPIYKGLPQLIKAISDNRQDRRDSKYRVRLLELKGLEDRMGMDKSFPVVEIVTEYRRDRWITFSPKYKIVLRDIKNPYRHGKIPIVQLRYYGLNGDPWGESEVEHVLPLWRAIQAHLCGYLDNMQMHIRPPLKVIESAARIETLVYGAESLWLMDRQDAVQELQSNGEAIRNFQATYTALVSAFNTAMGEISQGVSAFDPVERKKTATEIKVSRQQQNVRDQSNQTRLAEAIQDMMMMWLSNNRQFLFADEDQHYYVLKILGAEAYSYFKKSGLDEMELTDETMKIIADIIDGYDGQVDDSTMNALVESAKMPKYPVFENPNEPNPEKLRLRPKMIVGENASVAEVYLTPDDLEGTFDYIPTVKSMSSSAEDDLLSARQKAVELLMNPAVQKQLYSEGVRPEIKSALVDLFDDLGYKDAERLFVKVSDEEKEQGLPIGEVGLPAMQQLTPQTDDDAMQQEV